MTRGLGEVQGNLNNWIGKKLDALEVFSDMEAKKASGYAKENRRWTDRTSHARQALDGAARWANLIHLMAFIYHQVDYGVWLELAHDGKYAILEEARDHVRNEYLEGVKRIVNM